MDHFEMAEKLSQKAGVTFEEAKQALENSDWDMLDAMVMLEKTGIAPHAPAGDGNYTTQPEPAPAPVPKQATGKQEFVSVMQKLWNFICKLFRKGNTNNFVVSRHNEEIVTMPITVLALLVLIIWPASIILLIIGLFCGLRYRFTGPDFTDGSSINQAMDHAANTVQNDEKK